MRRLALFALLALCAGTAFGQRFFVPRVYTVGTLPSCIAAMDGWTYIVTDGASVSDCSTGSGSSLLWCICDGGTTTWTAAQTAIGEDAIGTFEFDDDANSPTAGDVVIVETGALSFDYLTPNVGTDITADLEEETHVTEHAENGADELLGESMGTACTDGQILKANATGGLDCDTDDTGGATDIISEGNSNVEVIDLGTGQVDVDIDGTATFRLSGSGLDMLVSGDVIDFADTNADKIILAATTQGIGTNSGTTIWGSGNIRFRDSSRTGTVLATINTSGRYMQVGSSGTGVDDFEVYRGATEGAASARIQCVDASCDSYLEFDNDNAAVNTQVGLFGTDDVFRIRQNYGGQKTIFGIEAPANGNSGILIDDVRYVGIGTLDPDVRLDVNGAIKPAVQAGDPHTCSATYEGAFFYDADMDTGRLSYCTGTVWAQVGSRIADVLSIQSQTTAPSTCTVGDIYVDNSPALCWCSATDTWTKVSGSGTCS